MRTEIADTIAKTRLVAIIRLQDTSGIRDLITTLVESGIKVLEITSNTPDFCAEIEGARKSFPMVLVGAGTIVNVELAQKAIASGAQFLVTPNVNTDVIAVAHQSDIPVLVGALTPTEIALALQQGADIIKLFPAGPLGTSYAKTIFGPFSGTRFFAVGGVDEKNAAEWLEAECGVGIGSAFTKGSLKEIQQRAAQLVQLTTKE